MIYLAIYLAVAVVLLQQDAAICMASARRFELGKGLVLALLWPVITLPVCIASAWFTRHYPKWGRRGP